MIKSEPLIDFICLHLFLQNEYGCKTTPESCEIVKQMLEIRGYLYTLLCELQKTKNEYCQVDFNISADLENVMDQVCLFANT